MNVDLGIWDKLTRVALFLIFLAVLLLVGWEYLPLIRLNERMRQRIYSLDSQIQKEQEESKRLKTAYDALRYDPKAIERLARERLGYAKTGETVIRFEAPATNTPAVSLPH
jgi:cell division protein FtsB